jgi:RNA polymerase sigma factor (sigma-70 family)
MSLTMPTFDGPGDAELISAVRGGDVDAYGELFGRHVEAARRLGRQLVAGPDVDDLVSEAFAKVLAVLQRGGGPDLAFRAYLLTAVRRLHVDRIRATSRLHTTDDLTPFDPGVPFRDTAVEGFENAAAARAFASLPERWQMVLWHTEVEGQKPADVALLLGMSANSVSALAYRAREGLRQAFISMHVQSVEDDEECAWTHRNLGSYIRNGVSRRDATRVRSHLDECRRCMAIYLELTEVNSNLAGVLAPLLLGGAAAAYLGSAGGAAVQGGLLFLLGRARDLVMSQAPVTAVAGVAATAVVAGTVFVAIQHRPDPAPEASSGPGALATSEAPGAGRSSGSTTHRAPQRPDRTGATGSPRVVGPLGTAGLPDLLPTPDAIAPASSAASSSTTPGETPDPGDGPGAGPGPSDPAGDPSGPVRMDLSVTASVARAAGVAFEVVVDVAGLAPGETATLRVAADTASVALTLDPRCSPVGVGAGTCADTLTPTTFSFLVGVLADSPATLTFTVQPDGAAVESDPGDNTVRVVLTPRGEAAPRGHRVGR